MDCSNVFVFELSAVIVNFKKLWSVCYPAISVTYQSCIKKTLLTDCVCVCVHVRDTLCVYS